MTLWLSIWWEKKKNSSPFPPRRIQLNCSASAIFRWYDRWWLVLKVAAVKGGAGMEYWWLFWGEWGAPTEQGLTVDPGKYWTDCMRRNSYNETWNINISLFSCRFAVSFFPFSVLLGGGVHLVDLMGGSASSSQEGSSVGLSCVLSISWLLSLSFLLGSFFLSSSFKGWLLSSGV